MWNQQFAVSLNIAPNRNMQGIQAGRNVFNHTWLWNSKFGLIINIVRKFLRVQYILFKYLQRNKVQNLTNYILYQHVQTYLNQIYIYIYIRPTHSGWRNFHFIIIDNNNLLVCSECHCRLCTIQVQQHMHSVSLLAPSLTSVSLFPKPFYSTSSLRNMPRSNKYLASWAEDERRTACDSSCECPLVLSEVKKTDAWLQFLT
jgi:hypothetical protein